MGHDLYTISETAERLRVSRSTIYRLIASGDLLVIRLGTAPRIPAKVVERFIDCRLRAARIGNQ